MASRWLPANRHEKIAWFNLAVIAVTILLFVIVFFMSSADQSLAHKLVQSSKVSVLLIMMGFSSSMFKKKSGQVVDARDPSEFMFYQAELDERDLLIQRKAYLHSFGAFYIIFNLLMFGVLFGWGLIHPLVTGNKLIPVNINIFIIPIVVVGGMIIVTGTHAVSTVVQYRNERLEHNGCEKFNTKPKRKVISILAGLVILYSVILILEPDYTVQEVILGMLLGVSIAAFMIRGIRLTPDDSFTVSDRRFLNITWHIIGPLFTIIYLASTVIIIMTYRESGSIEAIRSYLFFFAFGSINFLFTIVPDALKYIRERRHEKA